MSKVTLTIGPKSYFVACAPGEEQHIADLGAMIAEKYALLGTARAPLEAQNLLFAALFLADELAELRKRPTGGDASAASPPSPAEAPLADALAERLEALAASAEAVADALEAAAANA